MTKPKQLFSTKKLLLTLSLGITCSNISAASLPEVSEIKDTSTEEALLTPLEIETIQNIVRGANYELFMDMYKRASILLGSEIIKSHVYYHNEVINETTKVSFLPRKKLTDSALQEWITLDKLPGFVRDYEGLAEMRKKIRERDYSSFPFKIFRVVVHPQALYDEDNFVETMEEDPAAAKIPKFVKELVEQDVESTEKEFNGEVYEMIFNKVYTVSTALKGPDVLVSKEPISPMQAQDIDFISADTVYVKVCSVGDPSRYVYVQCLQKRYVPIIFKKGDFTIHASDDSIDVDAGGCLIM